MADVVVIDDDDQLRAMMRQMLERVGHTVREAADGVVGLDVVRQSHCDLVVTNIFMPRRDGLEFLHVLHRDAPTLPVLAVSGGGQALSGKLHVADFLEVAKRFGAAAALHKPFEWEEFMQAVGTLLTNAHLPRD